MIGVGSILKTTVKSWLRDKEFGFLSNGDGPDIMVRKKDLLNCQYLVNGAMVEFDCYPNKKRLIGKNVKLVRQKPNNYKSNNRVEFGVMT